MLHHPDLALAVALEHRGEQIAYAERHRLLTAALRNRRAARRSVPDHAPEHEPEPDSLTEPAVRGKAGGTIKPCGQRAASAL